MKYRPRICYTEEQKALMWDRWQKANPWDRLLVFLIVPYYVEVRQ